MSTLRGIKESSLVITKDGMPALVRSIDVKSKKVLVTLFTVKVTKPMDISDIRLINDEERKQLKYLKDDAGRNTSLLDVNQDRLIEYLEEKKKSKENKNA